MHRVFLAELLVLRGRFFRQFLLFRCRLVTRCFRAVVPIQGRRRIARQVFDLAGLVIPFHHVEVTVDIIFGISLEKAVGTYLPEAET